MASDVVTAWLSQPRESLARELKSWIDPTDDEHRAALVKGMLALRNYNGGMIAIGFDNETGRPLPRPDLDWTALYHSDKMQSLASAHSSQQFEVGVEWFTSDTGEHPVIVVSDGVRTPVAVRSPIMQSGRSILPMDTVYCRTLRSNTTPSSAPASHGDWEDIMRVCFDNREADIGRFVRRHLSPEAFPSILAALGVVQKDDSLKGRSLTLLDEGEKMFRTAYTAVEPKAGHEEAVEWGYSSIALIVSPPPSTDDTFTHTNFLNRLYSSASSGRHTIPPWFDGRVLMRSDAKPYPKGGAYEMLLDIPDPLFGMFEFSRLDPSGVFFCRSTLREETRERRFHPEDTPTLDPGHAVAWVTEAFLTGAAFARALKADKETTVLAFAFKWDKLLGRKLYSFNALYNLFGKNVARGDDSVTSYVELPLSTPPSALAQYVSAIVRPLFLAFDWPVPPNFVERFTAEAGGR